MPTETAAQDLKGVGFDARQRYYEELMNRLARTAQFADLGDLRSWYLELHGMFNMVRPWIGKAEKDALLDGDADFWGLWKIRKKVYGVQGFDQGYSVWRGAAVQQGREIERQLLMVGGRLMEASQHMMLPSKEVGDDDPSKAIYR